MPAAPPRRPGLARWRQIADHIAAQVDAGHLKAGEASPSTAQVMEHYDVAKATAQRALSTLAAEGYISVTAGMRSTVLERRPAAEEPGGLGKADRPATHS
jgi:DNA-binding GntR family transcriptional regulator